jgi:hypothetical protein
MITSASISDTSQDSFENPGNGRSRERMYERARMTSWRLIPSAAAMSAYRPSAVELQCQTLAEIPGGDSGWSDRPQLGEYALDPDWGHPEAIGDLVRVFIEVAPVVEAGDQLLGDEVFRRRRSQPQLARQAVGVGLAASALDVWRGHPGCGRGPRLLRSLINEQRGVVVEFSPDLVRELVWAEGQHLHRCDELG